VPIVVLSSRGDEAGKVQAHRPRCRRLFDQPSGNGTSCWRAMRAALTASIAGAGRTAPDVRSGDLAVDLVAPDRQGRRREVKLSPKEYDLLKRRVLVQHAGSV